MNHFEKNTCVAGNVIDLAKNHGLSCSDHTVISLDHDGSTVMIVFVRKRCVKVHSDYRNMNPELENKLTELGFTVESF